MDSWRVLYMSYWLHYELNLYREGLVLLLVHLLLKYIIDKDLLSIFECLEYPFLSLFFLVFLVVKILTLLLLCHAFELFLQFVFVLSSTSYMTLPFLFRVIHVMLQLFYFYKFLFMTRLLVSQGLLVKSKLLNSFFKQTLHICWTKLKLPVYKSKYLISFTFQ